MTSAEKSLNNLSKEKEALLLSSSSGKPMKRLKSPKKVQDFKKSANDMKIEDVFLNSEYFKYHSGNISALSFCSGDNGENQWTVGSKIDAPPQKKLSKTVSYPSKNFSTGLTPGGTSRRVPQVGSETIKSDTAVQEKSKISNQWQQKLKASSEIMKENTEEKTNKVLEGILSGKKRLDHDLVSLITEQMFLAERELQITRTHLIETISKLNERDLEILHLHEKIQSLKSSKRFERDFSKREKTSEESTKTSEDYQKLILASEKLKKQVKDMEDFLNDYGLVWVGEKDTKPDFDKIIKSFQRLNSVASEPKIIQTTMGAKFEIPRQIPIVLYSNGFLLRNTDFREYNTSTFLQDVEDGYFPSELQDEFPDGVPFEVVDKRNEVYSKNAKTAGGFQGPGNRLGSKNEGKSASVVYLEPVKKIRNYESQSSLAYASAERSLLKKFQKKRPRNASLQDERRLFLMHSDIPCQRPNTGELDADGRNSNESQINLKIRYGKDRTEWFVLQIPENEKMYSFQVALQRKLCEKYHGECLVPEDSNTKSTDFEIHVYGRNPFRLSDNLNLCPAECGIVHNSVVNVTEI